MFAAGSEANIGKSIGAILLASPDESRWTHVSEGLRVTVNAQIAAMVVHYHERSDGRILHAPSVPPSFCTAYVRNVSSIDGFLAHHASSRERGEVWATPGSEDGTIAEVGDVFRRWPVALGPHHHLFGVLEKRGQTAVYLIFARTLERGPFSTDETARLGNLLPTLAFAWRAERSARAHAALSDAAFAILDRFVLGAILINRSGRLIAANRSAQELFQRNGMLFVRGGQLCCRHQADARRLKESLTSLFANTQTPPARAGISLTLPARGDGTEDLFLLLTPPARTLPSQLADLAVVYAWNAAADTVPPPQVLCAIYGITAAEAEVAVHLCHDRTRAETAAAQGVSENTVAFHLKALFAKLGVQHKAAVVRLICGGPGQIRGWLRAADASVRVGDARQRETSPGPGSTVRDPPDLQLNRRHTSLRWP
jgi:DNA-binding CsgD family transcriptional regulator